MDIYGYLSNQWGFSETGRILVRQVKDRVSEIGIKILDPFEECGKELDFAKIESLKYFEDRKKYWQEFSRKVTPINNRLMRKSHCQFAILDGGHPVDDGVASEIGYYAALVEERVIQNPFGRIFALRSDLRPGENIGCLVNPQIEGYVHQTGGKISTNLDEWLKEIDSWYKSLQI